MNNVTELLLGWKRYEKARKLSPREWNRLHTRNLAGESFDSMIDALPEPATPVPSPGRAPLTDEQIESATGAKRGTPMWLVAVAFTRAIESAHGIAPAGGIGGDKTPLDDSVN